jgi:hypothetical protein
MWLLLVKLQPMSGLPPLLFWLHKEAVSTIYKFVSEDPLQCIKTLGNTWHNKGLS